MVTDNMTNAIASVASKRALTSSMTAIIGLSLKVLVSVLVPKLRPRLCVRLRLGRSLRLISWGHLASGLVTLHPTLGFLL